MTIASNTTYQSGVFYRGRQYIREDFRIRFWNNVLIGDKCWEWQKSTAKNGYGQFNLEKIKGQSDIRLAHRLSYEMMVGQLGKFHVLHKCDNRKCVRPSHLYLGDEYQNSIDKQEREGHWFKYSPEIVSKIKSLFSNGKTRKHISEELNIKYGFVQDVISGRARKIK